VLLFHAFFDSLHCSNILSAKWLHAFDPSTTLLAAARFQDIHFTLGLAHSAAIIAKRGRSSTC
jgi:hypothetical protein